MEQNVNAYYESLKKARVYFEGGKYDEAITSYKQAVNIDPFRPDAYYEIGQLLQFTGRPDDALEYYMKTLELNPGSAQAYANIGLIIRGKGDIHKAIEYYKKATMMNPDYASAYYWLGNAYNLIGKLDEAIVAYDKAAQYEPYHIIAQWMSCMCQLPVIYPDTESINIHRKKYRDKLLRLRDAVSLETPEDISSAAEAVGSQQPFYLPYQGLNDYELQKIYGELVCRIMSARYPQFSTRPQMPHLETGEKIRVGIVSGYFYCHSNWKLRKGWVENIDQNRFTLYGYYTGTNKDDWTDAARQLFNVFVEDVSSFEELCSLIRRDKLHVLIYPEIGMDPVTLNLASLRLAPVQCTSWGHPETSGLPTIDYFLSSDLMEPLNSEVYYTEKLIRLPNLSIYYSPIWVAEEKLDLEYFSNNRLSIFYLCFQSLCKYLPQYDYIYPQIAREAGECRFFFISHKSPEVTQVFYSRLQNAFQRFNMQAEDFVTILPHLSGGQFRSIIRNSDVYLDSIGWSGCNSTFEAIADDLPVVTMPGNYMRGRHSEAILRMMGLTDTIAGNIDEYIDIAVGLGKNPDLRKSISDKIAQNKYRIYGDKTAVRGLEEFLIKAVSEK